MMPKHLIILLLTLSLALFPSSSSQPEPFATRLSCGARYNVRTKPTNTLWFSDFGYTGGRPANATRPSYISPPLKTLRYFPLSDGPENCYNINKVPNGHYSVRIFFGLVADPNFENEPLFEVSVEGTQINSLRSGWSSHDDESFTEALVIITDGSVSLCFHSTGHGDPAILSIEILQVDDKAYYFGPQQGQGIILRTSRRLNCGAMKPKFDQDYSGDPWGGDRFWNPIPTFGQSSDQAISTKNSIKQASVSPNFYPEILYQTALLSTDSQPDLSYTMYVDPNRNYSIWLHFAEIDPEVTGEGQRIFDILINGDIAFKDVDIIHMSGDRFTAIVLNVTVAVNGRTLTLTMHPTKGSQAIINAIEVFGVIIAESKTLLEEGIGGVLSDSSGQCIMSFSEMLEGDSSIIAEAQAIRSGLFLASNAGVQRLVLKSDAKALIDVINMNVTAVCEVVPLILDIKQLLSSFCHVSCQYIPWVLNREAHHLAKGALRVNVASVSGFVQ
ncbi:hypothetical protein HHK36_023620 [Tetracentron sinense]|uniref:Malectin-like domain-containing protein n=1 Tax=Tetracentron sinense TaxID=13715 RepID=A0A834YQK8_TETSI|nr:hypothetical protein HHK36_023620 [Tetracentron sinense]